MTTPPMGQQPLPPQQPTPDQEYSPPPPPPPAAKSKRFGWLALGGAAFAALLIGVAVGTAGNGGQQAASPAVSVSPGPTVTVTVTTPPDSSGTDDTSSSGEPDSSTFSPKKSEFEVSINITGKQCFGSAGCSISFKPKLAYGLDQGDLPSEGITSVTYEVSGTEDDFTGTLELSGDGTYTGGDEQNVDTSSSSKKLVAKVTEVSYNQYG